MPVEEGQALLHELMEFATQPQFVYCHKWQVGDLVIWDNASLLHSATLTAPADPRTLWRITVKEPSTALDALVAEAGIHMVMNGLGRPVPAELGPPMPRAANRNR